MNVNVMNCKKQIRGGQIEIFDFLRFPLICIVVLIHTLQADEHVEFGILYHDALYFFQESIGRSAVPVFFVISGYLFFYKVAGLTTEIYKSKLKRRVKSLLIPYLIWNALALLECCIKHLPVLAGLFPNIVNQPIDVFFCIKSFWCTPEGTCPIYYPFWYIRDLMMCVLLTPVIYFSIKKLKLLWLLLLFAGMLFKVEMIPGLGFGSLFYFSAGCYWAILKAEKTPNFYALMVISLCWIPFAVLDTMTKVYYFHLLSNIFGVGCLYFVGLVAVRKFSRKISRDLIQSVFFIFATHAFFVGYISKGIFALLRPSSEIVCFLLQFVIMALTIMFSREIYIIINRYAPKLSKVLTGKR